MKDGIKYWLKNIFSTIFWQKKKISSFLPDLPLTKKGKKGTNKKKRLKRKVIKQRRKQGAFTRSGKHKIANRYAS